MEKLLICTVLILSQCQFNIARRQEQIDLELTKHRLDLAEEGLRTYVYEAKPKIKLLEDEVKTLKEENAYLSEEVHQQKLEIVSLQWATRDALKYQLTREERDTVMQLKWTIFDLTESNKELQEEACYRNTQCDEWGSWSRCSMDCGRGTRIRSRDCVQTGRFSSMCAPADYQEETCLGQKCSILKAISDIDCPENYTSYQGYCFRFSGRQDARILSTIICEKDGAHMVSIDNDVKQKVVWDFISIAAPEYMVDMNEDFSNREYWDFKDIDQKTNVAIDGIRRNQQTTFVNWRDEIKTYFHWAVGEPRNSRIDGSYCATLNVLTGEWYMRCCDVTFFYVCETEQRRNN